MPSIEREPGGSWRDGEPRDARPAGRERSRQVRPDEARGAGDEDGATVERGHLGADPAAR